MPSLVKVNLRFAGQMKDRVLQYMLDRTLKIKHLQLDAANLISDDCWRQLFVKLGTQLESLKLSNLDSSFDDESVELMSTHCTNLRRLKLEHCWKLSDKALHAIARLSKTEHLSFEFLSEIKTESVVKVVETLGHNLRTLSLRSFHDADDKVLDAIHRNCHRLEKLRLSDNTVCTDQGYVNLFTKWSNPPLRYIDVSSTRDVDNANPDGPPDPVGLASQGFITMMKHSGATLETLNISSCRHISHAAFEDVFNSGQTYPHLKDLDLSFQTAVDDFVVTAIFKSCPAVKKLTAFACFNVRDVQVPTGVALIGGLRAQDSIVFEGHSQAMVV
jgi:DNA repair protein RAD7